MNKVFNNNTLILSEEVTFKNIKDSVKGLEVIGFSIDSIIVYSYFIDIDCPRFKKVIDNAKYRRINNKFNSGVEIKLEGNYIVFSVDENKYKFKEDNIKINNVKINFK